MLNWAGLTALALCMGLAGTPSAWAQPNKPKPPAAAPSGQTSDDEDEQAEMGDAVGYAQIVA